MSLQAQKLKDKNLCTFPKLINKQKNPLDLSYE